MGDEDALACPHGRAKSHKVTLCSDNNTVDTFVNQVYKAVIVIVEEVWQAEM